ncbi:MAG: EAL domain-containing protein [Pseudomonadota bacterium]|nr:EAL domain-containing protein [Pseudomonadota bacterium]
MQTVEIEGKSLYSVFQPIYSFSNQACIGAEVLVRGKSIVTEANIPINECLREPQGMSKVDFARQLNRMHLMNWKQSKPSQSWVFLNLDFHNVHSLDDLCLKEILDQLDFSGHEIVVEVVESEIKDEQLFENIVSILRDLGCLIALDDFGAGHSNVDRIWKAQPDIVKLDRQVLLEATKSLRSQSILRNLTKLIQQSGSVSLLEGIETQEQAMLAMHVGVDLVQGFYFATPEETFSHLKKGEDLVKDVTERYPEYANEKKFVENIQKRGYEALFDRLTELISAEEIETEMTKVSAMSFVKRFFILDMEGYQISEESEVSGFSTKKHDLLKKGKGLCWKNRRYFVKALDRPMELYVSEPYRSLIDMQLCLTVSKIITLKSGERFVACFDVFYHDKSTSSIQISI